MNGEIQQVCCVVISALSLLAICFLNFSSKILCSTISFKKFLYIEEYVVSLIFAFWIFYLFDLKIALLFWVVAYLFINIIFRKNAVIKYAYFKEESYVTKQYKKGILEHKNLWKIKKFIFSIYTKKYNLESIKIYLKFHTSFFLGLLVAVLVDCLNCFFTVNQLPAWNTYDILLENILFLTVILYYAYKVAYKICVNNINSMWFDNKKFFNIYFLLHCIALYIVVIAISLG